MEGKGKASIRRGQLVALMAVSKVTASSRGPSIQQAKTSHKQQSEGLILVEVRRIKKEKVYRMIFHWYKKIRWTMIT